MRQLELMIPIFSDNNDHLMELNATYNTSKQKVDIFLANYPEIQIIEHEKLMAEITFHENALQQTSNQYNKIQHKITNNFSQWKSHHKKYLKLKLKLITYHKEIQQYSSQLNKIKSYYTDQFKDNFVDHTYWQKFKDTHLHQLSPWICKKIQSIRNEIFWSSIRLHKVFLLINGDKMINNINAARSLLNDSIKKEHEANYQSIYASLFLLTPVISTTFYSFEKMFKHIGKEGISYLLVDEAGMIPPQYAVGGIYRAKKTIIVGDPQQLTPIVTLPKTISQILKEQYNIDDSFDCYSQSVQTIADQCNTLGTNIDLKNNETWVGSPLIVHRRCDKPLFDISNRIAYHGMMIYGKGSTNSLYASPIWIHSNQSPLDSESHWIQSEGNTVIKIIKDLILNEKISILNDLFIITPFSNVKAKMKTLFEKQYYNDREFKSLFIENTTDNDKPIDHYSLVQKYLEDNIGTIHTFQGRQAKKVILLLGGNKNKIGALKWASETPNMLNVAVTRAKSNLTIIGNCTLWRKYGYFEYLAEISSLRLLLENKITLNEKEIAILNEE